MRQLPLPDATFYLYAAERRLVAVSGVKIKTVHEIDGGGSAAVVRATFGDRVADRPLALVQNQLLCEIAEDIVSVSTSTGEKRTVFAKADAAFRRKGGRIEAATAAADGALVCWSLPDGAVEWSFIEPWEDGYRSLSKSHAKDTTRLARWCAGDAETANWVELPEDAGAPGAPPYELVRWHAASDEIERHPLRLQNLGVLAVAGDALLLGSQADSLLAGNCIHRWRGGSLDLVGHVPEGAVDAVCGVGEETYVIVSGGSSSPDELVRLGKDPKADAVVMARSEKGYQLKSLVSRDGELYYLDRPNLMAPPRRPREQPTRLRVTSIP